MATQTEGYVSLSRSKLGPESDPTPTSEHHLRYMERDGNRYRAYCACGWSKTRKSASIAREALDAHILAATVVDVETAVG